ncbi:hypothetical protein PVAP13_1KG465305 [Panicum virgatum]|uniref:Uncharacterized protein n=1 Tax=Panicum virgatum TaxID=38727 RepID=A0A8T0XRR9_PANVG|nr:hypothetical protein PVAP13_1KG465305 [Panicum virgatum]
MTASCLLTSQVPGAGAQAAWAQGHSFRGRALSTATTHGAWGAGAGGAVDGEEETVAGLRRRRLGAGESERRRGYGSVGVDGAGVCAATEPDCLRACCTAAVLVRCGGERPRGRLACAPAGS